MNVSGGVQKALAQLVLPTIVTSGCTRLAQTIEQRHNVSVLEHNQSDYLFAIHVHFADVSWLEATKLHFLVCDSDFSQLP